MDDPTRADMAAWTGCVAGALTDTEFRAMLQSAGFEAVEIRETHRVHEHAAAAIIRARKPSSTPGSNAPFAIPECKLDGQGLGEQLERYRRLGGHASSVQRLSGEVRVRFAPGFPVDLLERTLEVEQSCCPFFHATFDARERRLTLTVERPDQDPRLDSLFRALS